MGNFTKTLVAVVVTSSSLSALADTAAISRGQEAVSHASRMQSAADARVAAAYAGRFTHQGSGLKGVEAMQVDRDAMSQAATARANANAQMAGARNQLASAVAGGYNLPHQVNVRKNSDMAVALADARQADADRQAKQVSATSYRLGEMQRQQMMVGSINVSAASLPGKTPVSLTVNGVSTTTTAAELAAVTPSLQVAVPHIAAFERNPLKGGANGRAMHGHANNDHGNGGSNSEGTHSAEAHGFGNGAHAAAGGGHQGGGFHY